MPKGQPNLHRPQVLADKSAIVCIQLTQPVQDRFVASVGSEEVDTQHSERRLD